MKLEHASYLDFGNELGKEELQLLHFFCKDTTERILRNVRKLDVRNTGALANSIQRLFQVIYESIRRATSFDGNKIELLKK